MTSRFTELIIDCHDPERLAEFWCEVLDYRISDRDEGAVEITGWEPTAQAFREKVQPPTLVFIRVPEGKDVKNRIHIDVSPINSTQEDEVRRLLALGASHVDIGQGEQRWVVLADPEGNEFCVLRSLAP
jgi:hypothetical protein